MVPPCTRHVKPEKPSVGAGAHTLAPLAMAVELKQPLTWTTARDDASTMLDQLQPNILKGHVRDHLSVLLLHFGDAADGRRFCAPSSVRG